MPATSPYTSPPRARPLYFDGCFGWLHDREDGPASDVAVVICSGLKEDKVTGHRSFRLLADDMAAKGYPTLRFDYRGTGDSQDIGEAEPWSEWQRNIHAAADWLREQAGARQIVLCGLRLGATLATLVASARDDVAGLILLAPVMRGRSYVRQISVESSVGGKSQPTEGLMLEDLWLPAATVETISRVDLRAAALPETVRQVLVHAQEPSKALSECVAAWSEHAVEIETRDFRELEAMLRPAFMSHEEDIRPSLIADWLVTRFPSRPRPVPGAGPAWDSELKRHDWIETPLRFAADRHLFGMVCRPAAQQQPDLIVVLANSSGDPHYGFAHAGTDMARRLASAGLATLRLDFDGLGDSGAAGGSPSHVFETDRTADIAAALDALGQLGYQRFGLLGLCSGAYHALHAALAIPRIDRLLLINLPLFQWRTGDAVELLGVASESRATLLRKVVRNVDPRTLLRAFLGKDGSARSPRWFAQRALAAGRRIAGLSLSSRGFARRCLKRLTRRTPTLLLFGEGDPGLTALEHAIPRGHSPDATIRIVAGLDHALANSDMRRMAVAHLVDFLGQDLELPIDPAHCTADAPPQRPEIADDAWRDTGYGVRQTAERACSQ